MVQSDAFLLTAHMPEGVYPRSTPERRVPPVASGRGRRVAALACAVAAIGMIDLSLTVGFMATTGLPEGNPLARQLASTGPLILVCFKIVTVALNAGILLGLRRRGSAEVGAWLSLVIMLAMLGQWARFAGFLCSSEFAGSVSQLGDGSGWTRFPARQPLAEDR